MKELFSPGAIHLVFAALIIAVSIRLLDSFFIPLAWGAVIAIATWPGYRRLRRLLGERHALSAAVMTLLVFIALVLPLSLLMSLMASELTSLTHVLININAKGLAQPSWVARLPVVSGAVHDFWEKTLAHPSELAVFFHNTLISRMEAFTGLLHGFSLQVLHRTLIFGFALLCLFFYYKDGDVLADNISRVGRNLLGDRWEKYHHGICPAVRATVNGLVLVGLAEGLLMGITYEVTGVPDPVILAVITGLFAIIPFGMPLAFIIAALLLLAQGALLNAAAVIVCGFAVLIAADHFVRPLMIGGAIRLPFLAVLFSLLGGLEWMGIVGLFIGPVMMVLLFEVMRALAARAPGQ